MGDFRIRRDAGQLVLEGGVADEDARFGVAEKVSDLVGRIGGVEGQEDRARAQAGQIQ